MHNNHDKYKPSAIRIVIISAIGGLVGHYISGKIIGQENENDYRIPGYFGPGEHIVSVPVDDLTEQTIVYEGHAGYKPMGINVSLISAESEDSGNMIFINTTEVQAEITGIDESGNILFEDFGKPINYTVELDENEYDIGEHIITVPCDCDDKLNIEYYDGYNIAAIARTNIGEGNGKDGCILYVNNEPVEYVYDETNKSYFGTPIEKGKVLEK